MSQDGYCRGGKGGKHGRFGDMPGRIPDYAREDNNGLGETGPAAGRKKPDRAMPWQGSHALRPP